MRRRHWLQGAAALALAGPLALRVRAEAPAPYDTLDLDWTDPARGRPVPVRLYRPQAMVPGARVPLIVFSHGIGGSRRGYSWLGRFVAAHGIASLHLQHVGSDRTLWSGGLFSLVGRLQDAAQADEALAPERAQRDARVTQLSSAGGAPDLHVALGGPGQRTTWDEFVETVGDVAGLGGRGRWLWLI